MKKPFYPWRKYTSLLFIFALLLLTFSGCYLINPNGGQVTPSLVIPKSPANAQSITLIVSGDDATIVKKISPSASQVELSIPAGVWSFELTIETPSAVLRGFTTAALVSGEASTIVIDMELDWTKLVMPDYIGERIIQIDDISGSGYVTRTGLNIGFAGTFRPYDIDFDDQGRIYIANYGFTTDEDVVVRIDDITSTTSALVVNSGVLNGIVAIAVDRNNGYLYFATASALKRWILDDVAAPIGLTINVPAPLAIQTIRGMAVGEGGKLYIAGKNTSGMNRIFLYNPVTQTVEAEYIANLNDPWDVLVKEDHLFVANHFGVDNYKIIRLNPDFSNPVGYGINAPVPPDTSPGSFYGPVRFVATRNKKITIIDDVDFNHKIVSISDISGTNWETFPTSGDGQAFFTFYFC